MQTINNKYIFWTTDPTILYKNDKYLDFIPTSTMSRIEQLNAITRFCIYFIILAWTTEKSEIWIQIPIIIIIFAYVLFVIFEYDHAGLLDEVYRTKNVSLENFTDDTNEYTKYSNMDDDYVIEAGVYDEKGNLNFAEYQSIGSNKKKKVKYNLNEFEEYKKASCRYPTPDNPFMNPTINDFGIEMPPEACNADDDQIQDKITDAFNDNLFRDVSDVFERQNSQRQYYTVPNSNPPDTISFAQWLYKPEDICKVDQTKCLRYNDTRYER